MAVDIKNLNHNQLNDLISKAQIRQDELRKEKVVKLREKVHALIKAEGYSFAACGAEGGAITGCAASWPLNA